MCVCLCVCAWPSWHSDVRHWGLSDFLRLFLWVSWLKQTRPHWLISHSHSPLKVKWQIDSPVKHTHIRHLHTWSNLWSCILCGFSEEQSLHYEELFSSSFLPLNLSTQIIWNTLMIISWPDWLLCQILICYGGSPGSTTQWRMTSTLGQILSLCFASC